MKSFLAVEEQAERGKPIDNPFGSVYPGAADDSGKSLVVRSKRGDRALEFEIPARGSEVSEWVVPVDPQQAQGAEREASKGSADYGDRKPSSVDREIQRTMPQIASVDAASRREIEGEMGLRASEEDMPKGDKSYLGAIDRIKSLFREGRYEAALLESEEMLKEHPTDPRLYEMRGTLLDRLGYADLARQSWNQALKLQPSNEPLRRFLGRRGERLPASAGATGGHSQ
jgi:tetratricopeptide (TPR) repeat protein